MEVYHFCEGLKDCEFHGLDASEVGDRVIKPPDMVVIKITENKHICRRVYRDDLILGPLRAR